MAKSKTSKSKKEAAPAAAAAVTRENKNGITRPADGTLCAKVWGVLDKLHAKGEPATPTPALEALKDKKVAEATVRTQYSRWRKFNGLVHA
jgi:hypothetical protein